MPLNIRSEEVNRLAEKLASRARVSKTEAVRIALVNELERQERRIPLAERLRPLLERVDAVPDTGLPADKAFFDDGTGSRDVRRCLGHGGDIDRGAATQRVAHMPGRRVRAHHFRHRRVRDRRGIDAEACAARRGFDGAGP